MLQLKTSKVKRFFREIIILSFVFNANCGGFKSYTYGLTEIKIHNRKYECWNLPRTQTDANAILDRLIHLTRKEISVDQYEAQELLKKNPVGICQLPGYLYFEFCGDTRAVGCYYGDEKIIWIITNTLVHELVHHYISTITKNAGDKLSGNHTHPFQLEYEPIVTKEFGI